MANRIVVIIVVIIACILLAGAACAFMPTQRGASYPGTVYLDRGIKGSVSGRVVSSLDQSLGVEGAYVAVIDPQDICREYANTTTNANGEFSIGGLGATYSSTRQKGPDGTADTLQQGMNMLMLYVNRSDFSETYSSTFGIDANHTSTMLGTIALYGGIAASPEPTATPGPTVVVPTVVVPTADAPTPGPATPTATAGVLARYGWVLTIALLAVIALGAVAVYFQIIRKRLLVRLKKK